jgi:hypothetical protein
VEIEVEVELELEVELEVEVEVRADRKWKWNQISLNRIGLILGPIGPIQDWLSGSLNSRSFFTTATVYADPLEASSTGPRSCTGRRVGADEVLSAQVVCGGAADPLPASSLPVSQHLPDVTAASSSTSLRWIANCCSTARPTGRRDRGVPELKAEMEATPMFLEQLCEQSMRCLTDFERGPMIRMFQYC